MKKFYAFFVGLLMLGSLSALTSCAKEEEEELIDDTQVNQYSKDIVGHWLMDNTQEHWRFDEQGNGSVAYGENWDLADDIHEGEGNSFQWNIDKNGLMVIYAISGVYDDPEPDAPYVIKSITSTKMIWVTSGNVQQSLTRQ